MAADSISPLLKKIAPAALIFSLKKEEEEEKAPAAAAAAEPATAALVLSPKAQEIFDFVQTTPAFVPDSEEFLSSKEKAPLESLTAEEASLLLARVESGSLTIDLLRRFNEAPMSDDWFMSLTLSDFCKRLPHVKNLFLKFEAENKLNELDTAFPGRKLLQPDLAASNFVHMVQFLHMLEPDEKLATRVYAAVSEGAAIPADVDMSLARKWFENNPQTFFGLKALCPDLSAALELDEAAAKAKMENWYISLKATYLRWETQLEEANCRLAEFIQRQEEKLSAE